MIETVLAAVLHKASAEIPSVAITWLLACFVAHWIRLSRLIKEILLMSMFNVWIWMRRKEERSVKHGRMRHALLFSWRRHKNGSQTVTKCLNGHHTTTVRKIRWRRRTLSKVNPGTTGLSSEIGYRYCTCKVQSCTCLKLVDNSSGSSSCYQFMILVTITHDNKHRGSAYHACEKLQLLAYS